VKVVVQHLQAKGFSREVASITAKPRWASTGRLYDARWRLFVRWAEEQGIDPFTPSAPQLTSFLHYLLSVKDLDPQTVKGYRTSLAAVLLPLGMSDAINSPVLSQLLKGMEIAKPHQSPVFLSWDLGVVLHMEESEGV
jgi:hypothetical protein